MKNLVLLLTATMCLQIFGMEGGGGAKSDPDAALRIDNLFENLGDPQKETSDKDWKIAVNNLTRGDFAARSSSKFHLSTPATGAAWLGRVDVLEALEKRAQEVGIPVRNVVQEVLEDPTEGCYKGKAVHAAAANYQPAVLDFLVNKRRVNHSSENGHGQTPLDIVTILKDVNPKDQASFDILKAAGAFVHNPPRRLQGFN